MRVAFALIALLAGSAAQAQPQRVEIVLANFSFTPKDLHLHAGQPVVLHFVNTGSGGHNYSAPEFFARAPGVKGGKIELKRGESRDVSITPVRGTYEVRCTHFLHSGFGMKGSVTVE